MASLRQLSPGRWKATVSLGRVDGRERQKSWTFDARTPTIAKRLAAAWEERLLADGRALYGAADKDHTVQAAGEAWLATIDRSTRPKYHAESRRILERDVYPVLGARPCDRVTVADVERLWRYRHEDGTSEATLRATAQALSQVFKVAVRLGWTSANPVKDAYRPVYRPPQVQPPSRAEVVAVLQAAGPEDARLFVVAAGTGLRRGELAAMRVSRLRAGRLHVAEAVSDVLDGDGEIIVKDTKTHAARWVALSPAVERAIAAQLEHLASRARKIGLPLAEDPFVWSPHPAGLTPPRPDRLSKAFAKARQAAGVKGVRLHDLRHFFATQSLAEGHAVTTVSGALGHRDSATTLKIYAHPDEVAMGALPGWVDRALGLAPELEA
jgi:integrase